VRFSFHMQVLLLPKIWEIVLASKDSTTAKNKETNLKFRDISSILNEKMEGSIQGPTSLIFQLISGSLLNLLD